MRQKLFFLLCGSVCLVVLFSGCSSASGATQNGEKETAVIVPSKEPTPTLFPTKEPTATITPTQTPTLTATPTVEPTPTETPTREPTPTFEPTIEPTAISPSALPGEETIPLNALGSEIPWLPFEEGSVPRNKYLIFNMRIPELMDPRVRQALSYAVDRAAIAKLDSQDSAIQHRPASVITPPETLGRDLYGQVGIAFDPQKAQELLAAAGYPNPSDFPKITFAMSPLGSSYNGGNRAIVDAIVAMWQEHLGIEVFVRSVNDAGAYFGLLERDSYDVALFSWQADYNDPHNFLYESFYSEAEEWNLQKYANPVFDSLIEQAAEISTPIERQILYIQAEHILCNSDPGVIPLFFYGNPFE